MFIYRDITGLIIHYKHKYDVFTIELPALTHWGLTTHLGIKGCSTGFNIHCNNHIWCVYPHNGNGIIVSYYLRNRVSGWLRLTTFIWHRGVYKHNLPVKINFEKWIEKKRGWPLSWFVIGDGNSTSVYNASNTWLIHWTEIELYIAITTLQREEGQENVKQSTEYKENYLEWQHLGR